MNAMVTSKEEILTAGRELIRREGWNAVNIRSIAAACGVSVGSIYNYFPSKAVLMTAVVESIWWEIFRHSEEDTAFQDTQSCIAWLYQRMEYGSKQYPGFFTLHSLGFMGEGKSDGRRKMQETWRHILDGLCTILQQDIHVRPNAFTPQFTPEKLADILFSLMLSAWLRQDYDPTALLEIVRRTLYGIPGETTA